MIVQTLYEAPGIGRVQHTSPLWDGRPHVELLFPLPVWPRPLDRQFYRFLEREPWHRRDLYFIRCPDASEPQPALSALDWGRFFFARYQTGYGSKDWSWAKAEACLAVQQHERELIPQIGHLHPCMIEDAVRGCLAPLWQSFEDEPFRSEELFHRNTVKKLARMGLLERDGA